MGTASTQSLHTYRPSGCWGSLRSSPAYCGCVSGFLEKFTRLSWVPLREMRKKVTILCALSSRLALAVVWASRRLSAGLQQGYNTYEIPLRCLCFSALNLSKTMART
ncbi:Protein of unknown function [Pyronema omphalodes CBS 100304]|uniref:Uncharacterized protein n=1 Tax=Pyronema omphalodes (strain CBS 100304) TaxID=1076935 RepID=U4KUX5_PYROM|nr:Protein of unknown function [Pyronema omphalodes CBS 100304]